MGDLQCSVLAAQPLPTDAGTVEQDLIAQFSDCVLGESGQIANLTIAMVDLVPYMYMYNSTCIIVHAQGYFVILFIVKLQSNIHNHQNLTIKIRPMC